MSIFSAFKRAVSTPEYFPAPETETHTESLLPSKGDVWTFHGGKVKVSCVEYTPFGAPRVVYTVASAYGEATGEVRSPEEFQFLIANMKREQ